MSDVFSIVTIPTPSLHERSVEVSVEEITTPEFQAYLDTLVRTMFVADGVGIASPQVGRNIRAIVVNTGARPECYMNPVLTKTSETMVESEEGCLSVPKQYGIVSRHKKVTVEAINRHGKRVILELKGFPAIVFQHEIDHLDGILFIDKATKLIKTSSSRI